MALDNDSIKVLEYLVHCINTRSYREAANVMNQVEEHFKNSDIKWHQIINYGIHHDLFIYDYPSNGIQSFLLTERGKKLQEIGALNDFLKWDIEDKLAKARRIEKEDILLDNHVYLTSDQRKTDKRYRRNTLIIASLSVVVAAVIPLVQSYLSDDDVSLDELRNEIRTEMKLQQLELSEKKPSVTDDTLSIQDSSLNKAALYHDTVESRHLKTATGLR